MMLTRVTSRMKRGRTGAIDRHHRAPVEVDRFEYLHVGEYALVRLAARWTGLNVPETSDVVLVATRAERTHESEALPDPRPNGGGPRRWSAGFSIPVDLAESRHTSYELRTIAGTAALPQPVALAGPDRAVPAEQSEEIDRRVREAEAGLDWAARQLAHERRRRRELEGELQATRGGVDRVAQVERDASELASELASERSRREALAQKVDQLSAELDEALALSRSSEELATERERTRALERQLAELRAEHERLSALADEVMREHAEADESVSAEAAPVRVEIELPSEPEETAAHGLQPGSSNGATTACVECDATGSCSHCGGKGRRFGIRCSECDGRGICLACGGPGYIWTG